MVVTKKKKNVAQAQYAAAATVSADGKAMVLKMRRAKLKVQKNLRALDTSIKKSVTTGSKVGASYALKKKQAAKMALHSEHVTNTAEKFLSKDSTKNQLLKAKNYVKLAIKSNILVQLTNVKGEVSHATAALQKRNDAMKITRLRLKYEASEEKKSKAMLAAAQDYARQHRGFLHKQNCDQERRYEFGVCVGHMHYVQGKAQLRDNKKRESKLAAENARRQAALKRLKTALKNPRKKSKSKRGSVTAIAEAETLLQAKTTAIDAGSQLWTKTSTQNVQHVQVPVREFRSDSAGTQVHTHAESSFHGTRRGAEALLQQNKACYKATGVAYGNCRETVNAAYMECATILGKTPLS